MLDTWIKDIRYALRMLGRSPLFTITAALSLAIGIGANTTIFSIASALLLRPLPGLEQPHRLVDVGRTQDGSGFDTVSYPNYRDLRERTTTLQGLYAYREPEPMSLAGAGGADRIYGMVVTGNYFAVLGVKPRLGRFLVDADDQADGAQSVVVLSHGIWIRKFAGDPAIVGQTVTVSRHPFMVAGIAPEGFQGTTVLRPDVWVPMPALTRALPRMNASLLTERRAVWLTMGGRLKEGVSLATTNAELHALGAALEREYPNENQGKNYIAARSGVAPGQTAMVAGFMALLMAIVGLILLIACVNVAGMLLARGVARRREIAVRVAIGAGRGRLVRQLLTETTLLFVAAGLIGLAITEWLTAVLLSLIPTLPIPLAFNITTDWRIITFATVVSLGTAWLSGLAPALQASRTSLVAALKADGLESGSSRLRLRNAFVVSQVTMSLMLVIVAGLFLRALQHAADIQPGFDEQRVDVVQLDLSLAGYTEATSRPFVHDLLERARTLPDVESAALTVDLPLDGGRMSFGGVAVPGKTPPSGETFDADWNVVSPDFFRTLKLPLLRGRDFTDADTNAAPSVAIVNEAFAAQIWPGEETLGKEIRVGGRESQRALTIIGVAANARLVWLTGDVEPYIYVPFAQRHSSRIALIVRRADDTSVIPQIRALLRAIRPTLPIAEAMPLSSVTAIGLVPQRIAASVAGSLGVVGLLLAAIGIYGVTSYAVGRRTREIGIRIALGADHRNVVRMILGQGIVLAGIGVVIGVMIAAVGSRLLESLLFGVRGLDPVTFGSACGIFVAVALVASYIPARRAASVDPMIALRAE